MSDVVKTLKIKKAGTPVAAPPPDSVPDAVPAAEEEAPAPAQSHVTLPKYAQIQPAAPVVKDSTSWTWVAIVATVAVVGMLALIAFQLFEFKFYADPPSAWTRAGMF
jgi:hypothetical protein